jgi:glycosyltransferase involved in cell wall biosynthesis
MLSKAILEKEIALLIPCYNEASTIQQVIKDFRQEIPNLKIYVYDNNSTDNTADLARQANVIVKNEYKQGKANVVRSMFRNIDADIYIMVDGDDTYPAAQIGKMLKPLEENYYYMIIGDRISNGTYAAKNNRSFHQFGNNLVRLLINKLFNTKLKDIMTGYRVFTKEFVKNYPVLCKGFELETEMTIFALNNNLPLLEIPIDFKERPEGSVSKLNTFKDGFKVILTIFDLFRHYRPFLFFTNIALLFFIISLAIGFPVILEYIKFQYIFKVPSAILASGLSIFALISFTIGLILDTIANIERKNFEINFNRSLDKNNKRDLN